MENELDDFDIENEEEDIEEEADTEEEETKEEAEEEADTEEDSDELETLRKENKTLQAQKAKWRDKANKPVEVKTEEKEKEKVDSSEPTLSSTDLLSLLEAKITNEKDVELVTKDAQLLGVSISEALKNDIVVEKLRVINEKRNTADSTNTRTTRAGNKGMSDTELIKKVNAGYIPEPGTKEAEQLFLARRKGLE